LDALSGGVANAQKAMEEALPAYSAARLKVVEAENNGGADNTLLEELQASGKAYHDAEAAYRELNEKIEAARKEYNDAVSSYTAHMNDVSEKYSAYHTAEQQYETAYAVWEYANTPYLMESSEFETGIGTGQLVDGTGIDFNDLDAPDALERYQQCLEEFSVTEQTLQDAKTAMDSQETTEDLGDDSAYTAFKDAVNAATGAISEYLQEDTVDDLTLQTLMAERGEALNAYRNYCAEATANGTHEGTVLLRDEEAMLWQQLMDAKEKGLTTIYNLVASDIVYDGAGNSVTDRIVQNLASQNSAFQDQLRAQQADTFTERQSQWVDTISFIQNRGEREWTNSMNEFTNLWKKWRLSARDAITEGEKEWTAAAKDLNTKVNAWNAEAAGAVSAAGSEQIYNSLKEKLTGQLAGMYARIGINRDNMPVLKTGVEQTLARALASMPEGIGILKDSAYTVDTTAGFSEMLDLGLSGALFERYEREMSRFSDRMSVMQSVKMGEAAYQSYMAILKQFSDDLRGMNKSTSDSVKTNIRDAAPYIDAPFEQSKGCWKIRYIRSYSLATGRKYGSLVINDYSYYVNTTVFLKKLKGIEGDIDFSNPYTYENIDPEELNLYISMEQEHLTKEINNVFCAGGRFEKHSSSEMQRLSQKFSEGYEKYVKGQAMVAGGWYSAPLAPGVPVNAITVAKVGGSIALSSAGCPWLAFALNSSLTALEAKDGGLTWKQAAVQVGINAAITGLSAGAGDLMGSALGGTKSMGQQIAIAAARSAVSTTGNTLASCIDYESGGGFGFSKDRFTDNKTWSQAGLSFATSFAASAATIGMKQGLGIKSNLLATTATTSINTVSSNFTVGGDGSWNWGGWGNIDTQTAVITGVGS
ncbi:MAG TPA: hypothetical protein PK544_18795, partial [Spirochaetota bacterium]|nr:hypothetical protein [Spirochaetota bacterium]